MRCWVPAPRCAYGSPPPHAAAGLSLTLATRSAAAGVSSLWTPDRIPSDPLTMSLGLDTETGDEVLIPFDERLLVSGASGTGKSWSFRPLMATAHLRGDLLLIDGKGEEANIWEPVVPRRRGDATRSPTPWTTRTRR